jgi:hypothetical protein
VLIDPTARGVVIIERLERREYSADDHAFFVIHAVNALQ